MFSFKDNKKHLIQTQLAGFTTKDWTGCGKRISKMPGIVFVEHVTDATCKECRSRWGRFSYDQLKRDRSPADKRHDHILTLAILCVFILLQCIAIKFGIAAYLIACMPAFWFMMLAV